ncbi:hypothetical protein ACHAXA_007868 [Cyclostephanos tholiformis]|uniref:Uncharacterized protein n=1 Tax=Cyclostephanos tholiformis TaxID=382380 RepID=A0ABD3R8X8_9STRA
MGNRSSSTAPSSSTKSSAGEEQGDNENGGDGGSGLYLSPELQARINHDFESRILQAEWDNYRMSHLERHRQRELSWSTRVNEIRKRSETLSENARLVHQKLDDEIDARRARLTDLGTGIEHDIDRLRERFVSDGAATTPSMGECLDVRADLSRCYNTLRDDGECRVFVQKLDRCVTDALRGTPTTSS